MTCLSLSFSLSHTPHSHFPILTVLGRQWVERTTDFAVQIIKVSSCCSKKLLGDFCHHTRQRDSKKSATGQWAPMDDVPAMESLCVKQDRPMGPKRSTRCGWDFSEQLCQMTSCWKLLPEVHLGTPCAENLAWHIPSLQAPRIFWVILCCLLGRTNGRKGPNIYIYIYIPIFWCPRIL